MVFTGKEYGKIDAKGRLLFPKRFKRLLLPKDGGELVLRCGFDTYLDCYDTGTYAPEHERLTKLSNYNEKTRYLKRQMLSRTFYLGLDSLGRLLFPRIAMEHARLEKEVMLLGVGDHIELWSPAMFEQGCEGHEDLSSLANRFLSEEA